MIKISYSGPTARRGSRVVLTSLRFPRDRVTNQYGDDQGQTFDQALAIISRLGYTPICSGEMPGAYWVAVKEFHPLRDALASFLIKLARSPSHA